ncbi:MAG: DUF2949 domain-containing protein [Cyanobacteria bacterium]|nr:DUF2949 domain-containing protein [Cyanobacteriota bacterium]
MGAKLAARVNGAGPTGALAALALAAVGWRVQLFDPLPKQRLLDSQRAYAFTHSSRLLLQQLGLWSSLAPHLSGFAQLHLVDGALGRWVDFSGADLGSLAPTVGWIGSHGSLMALLFERLEANPAIAMGLGIGAVPLSPPGDGTGFDLVVAADGADSPTRREQGIGQWHHAYGQACLTAQVGLRGAAADQAWEILRPEGPFAVLPMGGGRHQLVWSAPAWRCRRLESLSDTAFLDALAGALPEVLQPEVLFDRPRSFPVALQLAHRLHRGNTVLVGDSAHRCHPVGGQGLNLGWRDVQTLMDLAARASAGRLAPHRLGAPHQPGPFRSCRRPPSWPAGFLDPWRAMVISSCPQPPPAPAILRFLRHQLGLSESSLAMGIRHSEVEQAPLPVVLWRFGLISLEQLEQVLDWQDLQT